MDGEATRIRELVAEACGLIEQADSRAVFDADLAAALELTRMDLIAAAFDTCDVQATDDACGAVQRIDDTLATLRGVPERAPAERAVARAG
jgi:hypothetical protein